MRRLDLIVTSACVTLGVFVGNAAVEQRAIQVRVNGSAALELGTTAVAPLAPSAPSAIPLSDRGSNDRMTPSERRRRLAERSTGTYIDEVLLAHDSALARWPARDEPLRVWVQTARDRADWNSAYPNIVRDAFQEWANTGIPLTFTHVTDSASADVRVMWVDRFDEPVSGKTLWSHDREWWIVDASIRLALHHQSGQPLDTAAVRAISLHESGHLIGLDHTLDVTNIMTPRVRVRQLSAADRATAQLLYAVPAGYVTERRPAR